MKRYASFILLLLLLILSVMLSACGEEAVYVQSVNAIMGYGAAGEYNICAGVVVAQNETKIEKDENRKVAELKVEVGQSVSEGDILFTYDMEEAQLTMDKAELELEQLNNSVADLEEQIAQLEKEKNTVSASEQLSYTVRIQTLETDKLEATYNISIKERELESMKNTIGNGEVKAPISGKVKSVNENGALDEMTGMPLPYIVLIEEGAYRVKGTVNEMNRNDFFEGQSVTVRSRTDGEKTWRGTIELIETTPEENQGYEMYYGVSDEMTSASSYPFYVQLEETEGLLLGQHVYVEPDTNRDDAGLWLNGAYIAGSAEDGFYVWAADEDDELEKREIEVGTVDEELFLYEIVSGLSGTDLIAFPEEDLREGTPITKEQETTPEDAAVEPTGGLEDAG